MSAIIAYALATVIPLLFLYLVYTQDFYQSGSGRMMAVCLGWGGISVALAFGVNDTLFREMLGYDADAIVRLVAPITEEILKGLIIVWLVRQERFTYFVDGAIYGFAVGMGFAIFENYFYVYQLGGDETIGVIVLRILSVNLIHAAATGLVGITGGLARSRPSLRKLLMLVVGTVAAVMVHAIYNGVVSNESAMDTGLYLLVITIVLGALAIGMIWQVIRLGLEEQMRLIEAQLVANGDYWAADDVSYLANDVGRAELVTRLEESFEPDKVDEILAYLTLQAQLAVQKHRVMELPDGPTKEKVESEVAGIEMQVAEAKEALGNYYLATLRRLFPVESPLWSGMGKEMKL
ncbi:MAG TPA: PrsW family intramembrane metalloprotease [Anaerolineae bacterium]|nr:PrsW family intramembrane metalloprotease [Anaerolineae bacterium]